MMEWHDVGGLHWNSTRHSGRAEAWRGARSVQFSLEKLESCLLCMCLEFSVIKSDNNMNKVSRSEF